MLQKKAAFATNHVLLSQELLLNTVHSAGSCVMRVPHFPLYRCAALFAAGMSTQIKYCFAWTLAEAGYTFAGLSFEGWEQRPEKGGQLEPKW